MDNRVLENAGVDVDELLRNLLNNEEILVIVMDKFLDDNNYVNLKKALEDKNYEDALEYAHSLKGVAGSLEMHELQSVLQLMVDDFRIQRYDRLKELFERTTERYIIICDAIRKWR